MLPEPRESLRGETIGHNHRVLCIVHTDNIRLLYILPSNGTSIPGGPTWPCPGTDKGQSVLMEFLPLNIFYIRVEVPDPDPGFHVWEFVALRLQISECLFRRSWVVERGAAHTAQSGSCNSERSSAGIRWNNGDGCGFGKRVD